MARDFGPFPSKPMYEVVNRRMQRVLAEATASTGFAKSSQGAVTAGTGAQLVIAAYPDGALVDGLYVENPTSETVTITTNSSSTPRIDRLVMRLDMGAETIAPFVIQGTPGASPQIPPLVQTATVFDMPLCRYTMPGSGSAQNPASIVDERLLLGAARTSFDPATGLLLYWDGDEWVKAAGPPVTLYENASTGSSGEIGAGAGQVGVLSVNVPAPGIRSDVGTVAVTVGMKSSAAGSIGIVRVSCAGVTVPVGFNVTSTNPVPVTVVIPRITLPVGTFAVTVTIEVIAGVPAAMGYSSVRVTA